ncbi:hypothetical protein B5X24_HaOG208150 [Helicoverpa armigera]|uniref:Uncharacterized protein n=1 Tax=Helicoverpa armigera TaxID=29058 RepID=A0A2W1BKN9_HELAM|nr:hypothetical protein B5X24_HaOG208150 [Helicoverpa armigera]
MNRSIPRSQSNHYDELVFPRQPHCMYVTINIHTNSITGRSVLRRSAASGRYALRAPKSYAQMARRLRLVCTEHSAGSWRVKSVPTARQTRDAAVHTRRGGTAARRRRGAVPD